MQSPIAVSPVWRRPVSPILCRFADDTVDLVVIGAGGAGLSAAVFAAMDGAKVLVVERTEFVGGTTAWSAGTTWVPGTHHSATVNPADTLAEAEKYLNHAVGEQIGIRLDLDHLVLFPCA